MTTYLTSEFIKAIRRIENDIVSKNYLIEGRLSESEIRQVLAEYLENDSKVTVAPDNYLKTLKAIIVENQPNPTWHVDYDLWINNKHSDLTLALVLSKSGNKFKIQLEDLHIM